MFIWLVQHDKHNLMYKNYIKANTSRSWQFLIDNLKKRMTKCNSIQAFFNAPLSLNSSSANKSVQLLIHWLSYLQLQRMTSGVSPEFEPVPSLQVGCPCSWDKFQPQHCRWGSLQGSNCNDLRSKWHPPEGSIPKQSIAFRIHRHSSMLNSAGRSSSCHKLIQAWKEMEAMGRGSVGSGPSL